MKLIKVLNPSKADELAKLGFNYTTENQGDKTIRVFFESDDLLKILQSNFSKKDYFIDKTMNF